MMDVSDVISESNLQQMSEIERLKEQLAQKDRQLVQMDLQLEEKNCQLDALRNNPRLQQMKNELEKIITFSNQEKQAQLIVDTIVNKTSYFHIIIALTQSGKTGLIPAILKILVDMKDPPIDLNNIYIISGVNDNDWRIQTKTRIPDGINTYHRGDLNKLGETIKDKNLHDVLIIIDEVHVASQDKMMVGKFIKNFENNNFELLKNNNVHTLMLDATPNKVMDDINKWSKYVKKYIMEPGPGYRGHKELLDSGQLRQFKDLYINDDETPDMTLEDREKRIREIQPALDQITYLCNLIKTEYSTPKYHIIRVPGGKKGIVVRDRFERIGGEIFGAQYAAYSPIDSKNKQQTIQTSIKQPPPKHTFIFIKEMARCALTFEPQDKENIGVLYERIAKKIQDDVIIQGLAGRITGYNSPTHIIIFTSIESIERYHKLWMCNFEGESKFTYAGKNNKKKSLMHPKCFTNTGFEQPDTDLEDTSRTFEEFDTYDDAKQFAKQHTNSKNGPQKLKISGGFYVKSLRKGVDPKVWCYDELKTMDKQSNGTRNNPVRYYVVYKDLNDSNTAVHVLSLRRDKIHRCCSMCNRCSEYPDN